MNKFYFEYSDFMTPIIVQVVQILYLNFLNFLSAGWKVFVSVTLNNFTVSRYTSKPNQSRPFNNK